MRVGGLKGTSGPDEKEWGRLADRGLCRRHPWASETNLRDWILDLQVLDGCIDVAVAEDVAWMRLGGGQERVAQGPSG